MKTKLFVATVFSLLLFASGAAAENVAGLPVHITKLDPKVIRVWIGDYISSTATVAIATEKGVVVVDTLGNPKIDAELRTIVARELGRSDFKVLINTHEHGDHTGGNSVYSDCTIVGQELAGAGMAANQGDRQRLVEWYTNRLAELKVEIEKQPADTPAAKRLQEELTLDRLNFDVLKSNAKMVVPNKTFKDRMKLDMGDTTFELYFIGGMHTASDIAIFVPEHGLLLTGDTMADVWLTDTPGCLASFIARPGIRHDFPLLLENWGLLLAKKAQIKKLVTGHWNGELTLKGFEDRVNYIKTIWEGVNLAVKEGKGLTDIQRAYNLNTRFPELAKSPGCSRQNNYMTILEMWTAVTKQESGSDRLYALIDSDAGEAAINQVLAEKDAKNPKYYFLEDQINFTGYRFIQENKLKKAITLFKTNVKLFPGSWNVYDSLGEALLQDGEVATATKMYEKSVELNPESKSGKDALVKIKGAKSGT